MAQATIKFIGVSGIHKEYLDQEYENVKIKSDNIGTVVFETENGIIFYLNSNFKTRFGPKGMELDGYFLIDEALGAAVVLVSSYFTDL
jgi:hypothetical protein